MKPKIYRFIAPHPLLVRGVFEKFCKRNEHSIIYLYKTNTKRMTYHYCTSCINILGIDKLVLLQFRLLSGVFINTALKMVRKRIE